MSLNNLSVENILYFIQAYKQKNWDQQGKGKF